MKHLDADTSRCLVELGLDITTKITLRWAGINAPEMSTPAGKAAKSTLGTRLPEGSQCLVRTIRDHKEKFGRYLGIFLDKDGINLNDWLVAEGHAVPYDGHGSREAV